MAAVAAARAARRSGPADPRPHHRARATGHGTTASTPPSGATARPSASTPCSSSTPRRRRPATTSTKTVNYGELAQQLHAVLVGEPVDLLETLAQRLADVCLADPLVDAVEITVHKPQADLGVPFDDVTVAIRRERGREPRRRSRWARTSATGPARCAPPWSR